MVDWMRREFLSLSNTRLEKAMAPHSSTLAWKIPWTGETGRLQSMGSRRVGHDWVTSLSLFTFMHWRRKWQPTPLSCIGEGNCNPLHFHALEKEMATHSTFMHWRRKWQPTPVFLPGESQGRGSPVGCCVYGVAQSRTRLKWLNSNRVSNPGERSYCIKEREGEKSLKKPVRPGSLGV